MSRPGSGEIQCHTCRHRERAAIDLALARKVSVPAIAKRYKIDKFALYRHAKHHLPAHLRAKLLAGPSLDGVDLDKLKETESQSILMNLVSLRHRLWATLDTADEAGDGNMISRVASQIHSNLELTGKLLGDLGVGSTTINNVLLVPAYVELRVALVRALQPFPEARAAVAQVLHRLEGDAAKVIEGESRELAHGDVK